jgi:glycine cleavage system H lipoate-binding protein
MTQKVYKTAQGKTVDMGRLMLQNEKTRAVGNMKVNARGDLVDDMNNVISSKPQQVNKQYNKQVQNPKGTQ